MAYPSRGRKPIERASKISHAEIINNPDVQTFLEGCRVPKPADESLVTELAIAAPEPESNRVRAVVAIDGGFRETPVREEYPSASITFFTFGPLLFDLQDLRDLDDEPFIAPEDLGRLKRIQRYTLVLPTRNIARDGKSLRLSVRETLQEFFEAKPNQDPPLKVALRWLLFRGWRKGEEQPWEIKRCPNYGCDREGFELKVSDPDRQTCPSCGGPIFLVDALRLHERIDEEQGAGGIVSYVMTTLEQLVLVHVAKALWEIKPSFLREVLFIKDGPLAFFGQTAPLCRPMRELAQFLGSQKESGAAGGEESCLLNVVGLEKSGAFVEHAMQIEDRIPPGHALLLSNEYIYKYIVPGDPTSSDPYGGNTYWGSKLIYKTHEGNVYVATVPTGSFTATPQASDFLNLGEILSILGPLRCSMYDHALIPVALANKLVSLSEFPSSRILETFARERVQGVS